MKAQAPLFLLIALCLNLALNTHATPEFQGLHWDWRNVDTSTLNFPKNFLWGFGSSAHQVEGNCTNNSWSRWEQGSFDDGQPHVTASSGIACDHWNRYEDDIALLEQTGAQAFRFSVEWSKIEPHEGVFDETVLDHYEDVCRKLCLNGLKPVITLHHYTDPVWFMDNGGFERQENIIYYVRFCQKVFQRLHPYVHMWLTFNSPSGYASKGYLNGTVPPGKKDMQAMAEVLKNMLEAHVQTYHTLKMLPGGSASRIGILKNIYQLDPWNYYNPLDHLAARIGNYLVNSSMYTFFTTGVFNVYIPGKVSVYHENNHATTSLDFIGLNYYSHAYMNCFKLSQDPDETKTQNPMYTLYPEGIYRAIKEIHKNIARPLNVPIYVTENGIATDDDDVRREHAQRYLYALSCAIEDGYDVRGYIHWALMDNYEWGTYDKHYGVYAVDFATQARTLKPGADYLLNVIAQTRTP